MPIAYLSTGSNMGNRAEMLEKANVLLEKKAGRLLALSKVVETPAWGKTDQPDFLNQVVKLETSLSPQELLNLNLGIEKQLGRNRVEKWGPRSIDIDILFYDNEIIDEPGLQIPHPWMHERLFVLEPMCEIAPDFVHPVLNKTIAVLLEKR
jgi:2-amino-4-hydroxy-6-hydroxymethyldihydropteridine diphosphokinase